MFTSKYAAEIDTLLELRERFNELRSLETAGFRAFLIAADAPNPESADFENLTSLMMPKETRPDTFRAGRIAEWPWMSQGLALPFNGLGTQANRGDPCRVHQIGVCGPGPSAISKLFLERYLAASKVCWNVLAPSMSGLVVPHYVYPSRIHGAGWKWIALMFALTWTSTAASGLSARRTSVGLHGETLEDEETFRRLQDVDAGARRGTGRAGKLVQQIRNEMAHDPFYTGFLSHMNHPIHRCRAILEPNLIDASNLAIKEVIRRLQSAPSTSIRTGLPKAKALAWGQYNMALRNWPDLACATDAEVYRYFKEHLKEQDDHLPAMDSWTKYVSDARRHLGQQKWRKGVTKSSSSMIKPTGQSVEDDHDNGAGME